MRRDDGENENLENDYVFEKKVKGEEVCNYPNAGIMLEVIRDEYKNEQDRKKDLDSKASTFITVNIAILTIFVPLIPFTEFIELWGQETCDDQIVIICGCLGLLIGVALMVLAFIALVRATSIRGYMHVDVDAVYSVATEREKQDASDVLVGLIGHYYQVLRGTVDDIGNRKINDQRAKHIQHGIVMQVVGYVLLLVSTVILRAIV